MFLEAYANASEAAKGPSFFEQMIPFALILVVFYFFLIRPQQKRNLAHKEFLSKLQVGDEVITQGGLLGRIEGLTDQFVTLKLDESARVRVLRSQITSHLKDITVDLNKTKSKK